MTLSEFKAWFEGYTEGLDGAPTEKQFKRIKAKVAEITGTPITQTAIQSYSGLAAVNAEWGTAIPPCMQSVKPTPSQLE